MSQKRPPSIMGDDERAAIGASSRRTPHRGVQAKASPDEVFVIEEVTNVLHGEELRQARAKRPTAERLARLEDKHDALVKEVTETRVSVAGINGKLEVLPKLMTVVQGIAERSAEREQITFTAKAVVETEREKTELHVRRSKWELAAKAVAAVGAALGMIAAAAGLVLAVLKMGKC